jgi:cytochrome b
MARVWDPMVRIFHWSLVLSFGVAWFSSHSSDDIHQWAGYFAAGLILMRLPWGVVGAPYARFSQFVRNPVTVIRYLVAMLGGREARHIGHNPAGGAMVIALMAAMAATALTGWMMTTDAYFGVP